MKAMIVATLVLVLAAGSGRAERKPLDKIHPARQNSPGDQARCDGRQSAKSKAA